MTYSALKNTPDIGDLTFRGRRLPDKVIASLSTIDLDMGISQVTEMTLTFDDPTFDILKSGIFDLDTQVRYRGLELRVSVLETNAGGGMGGVTVRCRPNAVHKLKKLRGTFVMQNVSPATYVATECKKAGIKAPIAQSSPVKKRIARDVKEKGDDYDETNFPSAWTTFQRLANEIGYVMYEVGGIIYFGKPTWLVKKQPKLEVKWYPENGKEPYTIPEFRQSIDSEDIEVSLSLPLERSGNVYPGLGLAIEGFPKFSGNYLVTAVNYPLAGVGTISVTASTIRNPKPQKSGDEE